MKKDFMSLILASTLIAPTGFLWAADPTPNTPNTPNQSQDIKTQQEKLQDVNSQIKSLEAKLKDLRSQEQAATKAGNTTLAEGLQKQIDDTRKELRQDFESRHGLRMAIHQDMMDQHHNPHVVRHGTA